MKLVTPKFILREYERLMKALYNSAYIKTSASEREFVEKACQRIDKPHTPQEAMRLLIEMVGDLSVVNLQPRLFQKAKVSRDLITALKRHQSKKEARELLEFIEDAAKFECSWSQWDSESEVRHFRRVSDKEQWEVLLETESAELFKAEGIKLLYVEVNPKTTKLAERAKKELGEEFWTYFDQWRIWFQLRREAYYYFYL